MIMLTGCGNPAEEVLKEIETGDAAKAQQIYEKKVSGDSSAENGRGWIGSGVGNHS